MVFLGAVDYGALRTECMKRDQVRETLKIAPSWWPLALLVNTHDGIYTYINLRENDKNGVHHVTYAHVYRSTLRL